MIEKHLLYYIKKKSDDKNIFLAKSYSSSKKEKKNNIIYGESKINKKEIFKKYHQRNILFNNKISNNPNSTSTSSLSSSAEKNYLTPTKTNRGCSNGNDYYYESFNEKQNLFNNINISMPKIDYNNKYQQNKNLHLTLGTGINRINNNYFSGNDYGNNRELIVNRSFKFQKNKLVLCKKIDISNNNSIINDEEQNLSSKSEEKFKINKSFNNNLGNKKSTNENEYNRINNRYSIFPEKKFLEKKEDIEENKSNNDVNYNNLTKEKKYKNIVLRPHKIQKENQLKNNIKVNKYKSKESPDLIKKIIPKFSIKPKYPRVFKYK